MLLQKIKRLILGQTIPAEYVPVSVEAIRMDIGVKLIIPGIPDPIDITFGHLFLGYRPLLIALSFSEHYQNLKIIKSAEGIAVALNIIFMRNGGFIIYH